MAPVFLATFIVTSPQSATNVFRGPDAAASAAWATAVVTFVAALTALCGVWWQMRRQWLMNSASMITSLTDRFSSGEWRIYRRHSAAVIGAYIGGDKVDLSKDLPVLGFFENLGHLVHRRIVDEVMVWNKFGWYVTRYYLALTTNGNLIDACRSSEGDYTLWEEFEWLNNRMLRIYRRRGIDFLGVRTREGRIEELLIQEMALTEVRA